MPADGLAPSGAGTSAGAVMTKFRPYIYTGPENYKVDGKEFFYSILNFNDYYLKMKRKSISVFYVILA